ncbi:MULTISPECIES: hypothetical protein [Bacillaceae]|uniref:hypothetical protein n=1 Tax=Anoxybacillaceae TaxID=3120669 RepID=UPI00049F16D0|nr:MULTISPECIES: hypothetical protein [Bacillaceae]KDE46991.1 hypothetical protein DI44_15305 [Geobacillus sp. CAMR5420]RDE36653.1 hypothetical protein DV713_00210 [Parageobacillus thermoglucosidasius]
MKNMEIKSEQSKELILPQNDKSEKVADFVNQNWKLELLWGWNSEDGCYHYAVRFTSKAKNPKNIVQSVVIMKEDLEDKRLMHENLRKLGRIGKIEQRYLAAISSFISDVITKDGVPIEEVEDMYDFKKAESPLPHWINLDEIISKIEREIENNAWRFPLKTSNEFSKEDSHGAILDHKKQYKGYKHPVAIQASVLRQWIKEWVGVRADRLYREILEELIKRGVIEGNIEDRRLSKNITVAENVEISAYQFNFLPRG